MCNNRGYIPKYMLLPRLNEMLILISIMICEQ